jgi:hypothetical protein
MKHSVDSLTKYKKKIFKSDDIFVAICWKGTMMILEVDERPTA